MKALREGWSAADSVGGDPVGIFSDVEIQRRVEPIATMARRTTTWTRRFCITADHVYYIGGVPLLSEWGRPMALVLSQSGDATLIEAAIEHENAARNSWITTCAPTQTIDAAYDAVLQSVVDFLNESSPATIDDRDRTRNHSVSFAPALDRSA